MFVQNFVKLSAAVHELSCPQTFLPYLAIVKNSKIRSCDLDLWPMALKFSDFKQLSRHMFVQNFIKLSAAVHELSL